MAVKFIKGAEVKTSLPKGISLVNVFGTWCGPCKMFAPILEELSDKTPVFKIDIDQNQDFAKEMGIKGVPTTYIYKDGVIIDTLTGFVGMDEVQKRISKAA